MPRSHVLAASVAASALAAAAAAGPPTCPPDLSGNGVVDFTDITSLLAAFGECPDAGPCPADLNGDDVVGFEDLLQVLSAFGFVCPSGSPLESEIAARRLPTFPFASFDRTYVDPDIASGDLVAAVDPGVNPLLLDVDIDLWIVPNRTAAEWAADSSLVDVRGAAQPIMFTGASLADTVVSITGTIPSEDGTAVAAGYDVVLDVDRNGVLSGADVIDGLGDEAGMWMMRDGTAGGPFNVAAALFNGGGAFEGQIVRYPTDGEGPYPLVVISHGNGHNYTWYAYLQTHLASYGYVVMSHQNETQPGIQTASTTTLRNTDLFLGNLGTIAGGVLDGMVDSSRMTWIGHSRGGEGVVRAYDRIRDNQFNPTNYDLDDIRLISSIAPTDFLGSSQANPGEVWYHLLYGAADGDVSGNPGCAVCQSFSLFERATANRASTYLHAADHNDFNCCGFNDYCAGGNCPPALGRDAVQEVTKAVYLNLLAYVIRGEVAAEDAMFRQYEDLRPASIGDEVVVARELRVDPADAVTESFVIDDFQSQTATSVSSSGGAVTFSVGDLTEGRLDDNNSTFTSQTSDPMNGMARGRSSDQTRGIIFEWNGAATLQFDVVDAAEDFASREWLVWRSALATRDALNNPTADDADYQITLIDADGTESSIRLSSYGGGVQRAFARTGAGGGGGGWQNEFESHRIRVADFARDGRTIDLTRIAAVRFDFGPAAGTSSGRLGFDDLAVIGAKGGTP
ncbi:MAG: hypothetical protein AB8G96_16850 [Phycisphaerales bacterium]